MKNFTSVEQDGGLWQIWKGETNHTLGYVFNAGYLRSERDEDYVAFLDWDSVIGVGELGKAKSFMGAVSLLFKAQGRALDWAPLSDGSETAKRGETQYWVTCDAMGHYHVADNCGAVWGDFWSSDAAKAAVEAM